MKSILAISVMTLGWSVYAQCEIQGPLVLNKDATQTYRITGNLPDCTDCFHWNVAGSNLKAITRINQKSVTIQTLGYGSGDMVASYQTPYGEEKCSISIAIVQPGEAMPEKPQEPVYTSKQDPNNCQILASNLEIKQEDGAFQLLIPKPLDIYKFSYNWMVAFSDGTTEYYTDRIPVVYTPPSRTISQVKVEIKGDYCSKNLEKRFSFGSASQTNSNVGGQSPQQNEN